MPRERKKGDRRPLLSPCSVTFGPVTLQCLFPHLEFALGGKGGLRSQSTGCGLTGEESKVKVRRESRAEEMDLTVVSSGIRVPVP